MDMMSVLWQFGILAAILVFGIKVGLASGLANLSKKITGINLYWIWWWSSIDFCCRIFICRATHSSYL